VDIGSVESAARREAITRDENAGYRLFLAATSMAWKETSIAVTEKSYEGLSLNLSGASGGPSFLDAKVLSAPTNLATSRVFSQLLVTNSRKSD
jgi:hypothetical protein